MVSDVLRIMLFSADTQFSGLVTRRLGPGFTVRSLNQYWMERKDLSGQDVVLLDFANGGWVSMAGWGMQLMDELKKTAPYTPIIAIVSYGDDDLARKVMSKGAFDTLARPSDVAELRWLLRRAHQARQAEEAQFLPGRQARSAACSGDISKDAGSTQQLTDLARKISSCDVSVLITGETGTGKNLLARTIHQLSSRRRGPFVTFPCANLPETLMEDELFGHERGAFTDTISLRRGRFEEAEGGTLFLDEIGDLPLALQAKLLRVLQQRVFERLGGSQAIAADIRVISATHRDLRELSEQGRFRQDLYYRFNVVEVHLPPLRERRGEVPVLASYFLTFYARMFQKRVERFSSLALHALEEYNWPGNVRELENTVQRAVVMSEGRTIELWHLPKSLSEGFPEGGSERKYEEEVRDFKRRLISRTLIECGGSKPDVARTLGVPRSYLHRLINQLEIPHPETFVRHPTGSRSSPPPVA